MVAEAKGRVQNLSPEQVAAEIDGGDVTLVDVREDDERAQNGAIPGAVRAPRGMLEFWADPISAYHREEFSPDRRTVLYCAFGEDRRWPPTRCRGWATGTSPTSMAGSRPGRKAVARWRR
jgi:rhodanese-related sulfurtransferase